MCGRYASFRDAQDLADYFALREIDEDAEAWQPSWNVAPTQNVRIITPTDTGRRLRLARWGLVPSWAKEPSIGTRMINARSETLADKPAFRSALSKRRCAVVADAYYEWRKEPGGKVPFAIARADGGPFAFAGLYEFWRPAPDAEWLVTTSIVTMPARPALAALHDREPLILTHAALASWLGESRGSDGDPMSGREALAIALDGALPEADIEFHPVATAVGSVANNGPQLLAPAD